MSEHASAPAPGQAAPSPHRVFSYGTLRQANVQQTLYGRAVPTVDDTLTGWRLEWVQIIDPAVIAASGSDRHPILRPGSPSDMVAGAALALSDADLAATDDYEVDDYVRVLVRLASGVDAYVYVAANDAASGAVI
ncbi:gamma-glutamylcyclotransferase family protein [Leucobacter musarum]|uniref:gamma-glutamylcyclotransferase family protein n=1 Tax=Leucobacter musarum TaxID=1930747 RepID=UPI0006A7A7DD|nr:gamma-glutamylcyclotransferase family protein [Leucobacter musarum]